MTEFQIRRLDDVDKRAAALNCMRYDDDERSCFRDEVDALQSPRPDLHADARTARAIYICLRGDDAVGCAIIDPFDNNSEYLRSVCVHHAYRGRRIGHHLVRHATRRHPDLVLHIFRAKPELVAFYRAHGFEYLDSHPTGVLMRRSKKHERRRRRH